MVTAADQRNCYELACDCRLSEPERISDAGHFRISAAWPKLIIAGHLNPDETSFHASGPGAGVDQSFEVILK